ncbi:MAG: hypothetical protein HYW49_02020 [Deltaproteobacteria bacterium]|nr:hypothetical protein [Deltaproteobacteria bacterium]
MGFQRTRFKRTLLVAALSFVLGSSMPALAGPSQWVAPRADLREHLGARLTPKGIRSLLNIVVSPYFKSGNQLEVVIPAQTISRKMELDTKEFGVLTDISKSLFGVDLTSGLPMHVRIAPTTISAAIGEQDFDVKIIEAGSSRIRLALEIEARGVAAQAKRITVCENADCKQSKGVRVDFDGVTIAQKSIGAPIRMSAAIDYVIRSGRGRFKITGVSSNLGEPGGPLIEIGLGALKLPPVSIRVNAHEVSLDANALKQEILKHKQAIAKEVLHDATAFIAEDLAELLNKNVFSDLSNPTSVSGSFERSPPVSLPSPSLEWPADRLDPAHFQPAIPPQLLGETSESEKESALMRILRLARERVFRAFFRIAPAAVSIGSDGVLAVSADGELSVGTKSLAVGTRLGHGNFAGTMETLRFESAPNKDYYHFAVAVSEPLVNGVLDLARSQGIIRNVLEGMPEYAGLICGKDGIRVHFRKVDGRPRVYVVLNLVLDVASKSFWGGVWEKWFGAGGTFVFPLELQFEPRIREHEMSVMMAANPALRQDVLELVAVNSPIRGMTLANTFGYPMTDFTQATETVRREFFSELSESIAPIVNGMVAVPIADLFRGSGLMATPSKFDVEPSGHLVVYGLFSPALSEGATK